MEIFVNQKEFQSLILDLIISGKYKEYVQQSTYAESKEFSIGFMLGLNWAALLTSQCDTYYAHKSSVTEEEVTE